MNTHNKLLKLGFKKHPQNFSWGYSDEERKYTLIVNTESDRFTSTYLYKFTFNIKIFVITRKNIIDSIYIIDSYTKCIFNRGTFINSSFIFESKNDLLNLLPKEIQRDFKLNQIL